MSSNHEQGQSSDEEDQSSDAKSSLVEDSISDDESSGENWVATPKRKRQIIESSDDTSDDGRARRRKRLAATTGKFERMRRSRGPTGKTRQRQMISLSDVCVPTHGPTESDAVFTDMEDEDDMPVELDMINLMNIIHPGTDTQFDNDPNSDAASVLSDVIPVTQSEPLDEALSEDCILRDESNENIYIRRILKSSESRTAHKKKTDRVYNSVHACYYCGKLFCHIRAHMKSRHKTEKRVSDIIACSDQETQDKSWDLVRAAGDDKHNCQVVDSGEGEMILSRRPQEIFKSSIYGPCPKCRQWMLKETIDRHQSKCKSPDQTKLTKKNLILQSNILSGRFKSLASKLLREEVFTSMTCDEVTDIAQKDPLIVMLGESWLRRNISNKLKRKNYTSGRMRLAAKLLKELRTLSTTPANPPSEGTESVSSGKSTSADVCKPLGTQCSQSSTSDELRNSLPMWNFLTPKNFDNVAKAALLVSLPEVDDEEELKSPSNAIKLKYDVLRLVHCKWAYILKNFEDDSKEAQSCKNFIELMKIEWAEKVTRMARMVLEQRKLSQSSNELIPDPKDIADLVKYLKKEMKVACCQKEKDFRKVAILVQARLLVYNKRRSGELDAILLKSYAARQTQLKDVDQSLVGELNELEKYLLNSQELMVVRGKRGRPVPVLLPSDTRDALSYIADPKAREAAGIQERNKFLFPSTGEGPLRSYDSLKSSCECAGLKSPERISSVNLRKYTATLSQVLDMNNQQLEWLCRHLGHTQSVHQNHYRQMSGFLERTEVSKVFLIQDLGLSGRFVGRKTSDITMQDILESDHDIDPSPKTSETSQPSQKGSANSTSFSTTSFSAMDNIESDDSPDRKRPKTQYANRVKWTSVEVKEIEQYFKNFLQTKTTPGQKECLRVIGLSKSNGGQLCRRSPPLIIKKISNMNKK